jgi:hypothetical protein
MRKHYKWIVGVIIVLAIAGGSFFVGRYWHNKNTNLTDTSDQTANTTPTPTLNTSSSAHFTSPKGVDIQVFSPLANQTVSSPITIMARVPSSWLFEAALPIQLYDASGNLITSQVATFTLDGDWMAATNVTFNTTLTYTSTNGAITGKLIIKKDNPSGLPQNDDSVEIPIKF